jgi:hypothetical protein
MYVAYRSGCCNWIYIIVDCVLSAKINFMGRATTYIFNFLVSGACFHFNVRNTDFRDIIKLLLITLVTAIVIIVSDYIWGLHKICRVSKIVKG